MHNNFIETHSNENGLHCSAEEEIARCRENLIHFQSLMIPKDLQINMKMLKNRFKIKTSTFPAGSEVLEIFDKIAQRIILAKSPRRNWYEEDIVLLIWIVIKYCQKIGKDFTELVNGDWDSLGRLIPLKDADACKFKWLSSEKINVQQQPWSKEEDEAILEIMRTNAKIKWIDVSKELHEKTNATIFRTGKQCRERWVNHLDPHLNKGNWTDEEDIMLVREYMVNGRRWAEIAKKMKGRTENAVKNRFNSIINKEKKRYKKMKSSSGLPPLPTKKDEQEKVLIKNFLTKKDEDKGLGGESQESDSEMNSRTSDYDDNMDEEGETQSNNYSEASNPIELRNRNYGPRLSEESKFDTPTNKDFSLIKLTNISDSMKNNIDDSIKQHESEFSDAMGKDAEISMGESSMKIENQQRYGLQQPKLDNMNLNQGLGDSCGSASSSNFNNGGISPQFPAGLPVNPLPQAQNLASGQILNNALLNFFMTNSQYMNPNNRNNIKPANNIFFNQSNQHQPPAFQGPNIALLQNLNNFNHLQNLHNMNMPFPNINSSINSNQSGMGNSAFSNYNYPGGMSMSGMSMSNNSGQIPVNNGNINTDNAMQEESLRLKVDSTKLGVDLQNSQSLQGGLQHNIFMGNISPNPSPFNGIYTEPTFSHHPLVQKSLFSKATKETIDELSPKSHYSEEGLIAENSPKPYNPYGYESLDLKVKNLSNIDPDNDLGNLHWAMVNSKKNEIYFISAAVKSPNVSPATSNNNLYVGSLNSIEQIKTVDSIKARIIQPSFPWSVFAERSPSITLQFGGRGAYSGASLDSTKRSPNIGFRRPNRGTTLDQIHENSEMNLTLKKLQKMDDCSPSNYLDLSSSSQLNNKMKVLPH